MAAGGPMPVGWISAFCSSKGYNSRADEIVQTYNNQFDATLDIW